MFWPDLAALSISIEFNEAESLSLSRDRCGAAESFSCEFITRMHRIFFAVSLLRPVSALIEPCA